MLHRQLGTREMTSTKETLFFIFSTLIPMSKARIPMSKARIPMSKARARASIKHPHVDDDALRNACIALHNE